MNAYFFLPACLLAVTLCVSPAVAVVPPAPTEKLELTQADARTLDQLILAARNRQPPDQQDLDAIIAFSLFNGMGTGSRILPDRPEGSGVFYHTPLPFSLQELLLYSFHPNVPGEAIAPTGIRRNFWHEHSPVLADGERLLASPLPPRQAISTSGREYEEITPDATSGSYYIYDLNRIIVLAPFAAGNRTGTALVTVSALAGQSRPGLKGAVLGEDSFWNYVYTGVQGSTLPLVGWAETHIDDAATINIWLEANGQLTVFVFKWLKAGWSGTNVVNTGHINAGVTRYLDGLTQVLASPRRPPPEDIAARMQALQAMSDSELLDALQPYGRQLAALAESLDVDSADFNAVLQNGAYARAMPREERISELIKLYVKQQIGIPMPAPAP
jgi:hypothetical protein